jgi:hypothetical protein
LARDPEQQSILGNGYIMIRKPGRRAGTLIQLHGQRFWQKEWFDHWSRSDEETIELQLAFARIQSSQV